MNKRKLLRKVLSGSKNIRFADMLRLAEGFGFRLARTEGSHHIMVHPEVPRPLNLQEVHGQAKPYQVRQFLKLIEQYNLALED
jgi:predicted RNA binding protein YcfA (HicA-like mRNA interferase family)